MGEKKEKTDEISIRFTHDPEASSPKEMPSISRLLNRKKLNISTSSIVSPRPPSPPPKPSPGAKEIKKPEVKPPLEINFSTPSENLTNLDQQAVPNSGSNLTAPHSDANKTDLNAKEKEHSPKEISISFGSPDEPVFSVDQPSAPKTLRTIAVQPSRRKSDPTKKQRDLIHWTRESLQNTRDPIGKGLLQLLDQGAHSILYLSIHVPPEGKALPVFQGVAAHAREALQNFWKGMKWDPSVAPQMWKDFLKNGIFEAPLQSHHPDAQMIRKAFGATTHDWLYLARVGPIHSCRGMLVLLAKNDLTLSLQKALSAHFSVATSKPKAA